MISSPEETNDSPAMGVCANCETQGESFFCGILKNTAGRADAGRHAEEFPRGVLLFAEGQRPRGVYLLCRGRVKLSTSSGDARVLITDISGPGDVLGLSAVVSANAYEGSAETLDACRLIFINREEFLTLLDEHPGAWMQATRQLSRNYRAVHRQASLLGLSPTAAGKLASVLLEHAAVDGTPAAGGIKIRPLLTHEEFGQRIGASRETVTRLLNEFKRRMIIKVNAATLLIRDCAALEALALPR